MEFANLIDKILTEQKLVVPQQYTYPPRKSYIESINEKNIILEKENLKDEFISLYVHFPFVERKCDVCNLYAFECINYDLYDEYIYSLLVQLEHEHMYHGKKLKSIHFGGGDPLILGYVRLNSVYQKITQLFIVTDDTEISVEATPKSVLDASKTKELAKISRFINRLNIGMLPFKYDTRCLLPMYPINTMYHSIKCARAYKIKNISIDIMIGEHLPMEDIMGVIKQISINDVDTISIFPLTIRSDSKVGEKNNILLYVSENYYTWYDIVRFELFECGYKQENSYRFTNKKGGCIQEDAHYSGQVVLGIGCGARTYGRFIDSVILPTINDVEGIWQYIIKSKNGTLNEMRQYSLPKINEEAMICDVVLNQEMIDMNKWRGLKDKYEGCLNKLNFLCECGILKCSGNSFYFTDIGYKFHDAISLLFYSMDSIIYDKALMQQLEMLK